MPVLSCIRAARITKNLYVTNLSYLIDNQSLKEIFAPFGIISSAAVILDRATGRSKGHMLTINEARPREPTTSYTVKKLDMDYFDEGFLR